MADYNMQRYQRQMLLPGIGGDGQQLLQSAKVLVVGAGGLSCPALQYLVAAGIGNIGIADGDVVELSNLHRQILFNADNIGKNKAVIATQKLQQQNPDCQITAYPFFIQTTNAWNIIERYDIILDGSDNFSTRYLLNDICVLQQKPLVYGAIYRFEGQVAVFNFVDKNNNASSQYRDLFLQPPSSMPNCSEAGVMGVLPGMIGTMQANEVIKLITHTGKPLINRLLTYNSLNNQFFEIELTSTLAARSAVPANREDLEKIDYNIDCTFANQNLVTEITVAQLEHLAHQKNMSIIDVREMGEEPAISAFEHLHIPMSGIMNAAQFTLPTTDIIFICQSGIRSKKVAQTVADKVLPSQKLYSLQGGINGWLKEWMQNQ